MQSFTKLVLVVFLVGVSSLGGVWGGGAVSSEATAKDCRVDADGTTTCQQQPQHQQQAQETKDDEENARTTTTTTTTTTTPQRYEYLKYCHDVLSDCDVRLQQLASKEVEIEGGGGGGEKSVDDTDDIRPACIDNFDWTSRQCAKTCRFCSTRDPNPRTVVSHKTVTVDRIFANQPQILQGDASIDAWLHVRQMEDYMYNTVYNHNSAVQKNKNNNTSVVNDSSESNSDDDPYQDVRVECQLRHARCTEWAVQGECTANPGYMTTACAPACLSCRNLQRHVRCPLDTSSGPTALAKPGDLYHMFQRILTDPQFDVYQPMALSHPTNATVDDAPWVIVLENVLSSAECETMIQLAHQQGFKRSGEAGPTTRFDGSHETVRSTRRTSSTTWCRSTACHPHAVTQAIHQRIETLLGIPQIHYEYLQLLKYEVGEKYVQHHDYLDHHLQRNAGVRMLTVYMYLNDVPAGGSTYFADLGLSVQPKAGRVVIWPSVLDRDTSQKDNRTEHEAMPVEEGVKYGCNAWIHQRDFKTPFKKGCTN